MKEGRLNSRPLLIFGRLSGVHCGQTRLVCASAPIAVRCASNLYE